MHWLARVLAEVRDAAALVAVAAVDEFLWVTSAERDYIPVGFERL